MYVTLEPCLMCCGAIIQARINKVFYGTKDEKMEVKAGDMVIFSKYAGTEVKLENDEYIVVRQNDILAIVQ